MVRLDKQSVIEIVAETTTNYNQSKTVDIAFGNNCTDSSYDAIFLSPPQPPQPPPQPPQPPPPKPLKRHHQIYQNIHPLYFPPCLLFYFYIFIVFSILVLHFYEFIPWRIHTMFAFGEFIPWRIHTFFSTLKTAIFINYSSYQFSFGE